MESILFIDKTKITKTELENSYLNHISNKNVYNENNSHYYVGYVHAKNSKAVVDDETVSDEGNGEEYMMNNYNISPRILSSKFVNNFFSSLEIKNI